MIVNRWYIHTRIYVSADAHKRVFVRIHMHENVYILMYANTCYHGLLHINLRRYKSELYRFVLHT